MVCFNKIHFNIILIYAYVAQRLPSEDTSFWSSVACRTRNHRSDERNSYLEVIRTFAAFVFVQQAAAHVLAQSEQVYQKVQ